MKTFSSLAGFSILLGVLAFLPSKTAFAQPTAAPTVTLSITADREAALYQPGEQATFSIKVQQDGRPLEEGTIVCTFSQDGWKPQPPQTVTVNAGVGTISGQLDQPGFLLLRATLGKTSTLAGVGYDPLKIAPSLPVPDDFDQFWADQKSALAQVPVESSLTPVNAPVKGMEAFDVQVKCLGQPVSGYFGRPLNAQPKSLPAILFVHGAGVRGSNLGNTAWSVREGGMLALDINAHGIPNGRPAEFYQELSNGELRDYRRVGFQNRDECYFKGMYLRLVRAIDFLTSQPEWDGKTLIVYGSSQGGLQALAATGLDDRVSFICAGVPAGCDHTGNVADRISGWPKLVPIGSDGQPDPQAIEASRYFDCVNFATRAKCAGAVVTVGFIDTTCPPTSIYAAYNALPVPRQMHIDVAAGHVNTPGATKFMQEAALQHVRERK